uniref:Uncharacterized protein n=1 Tax=Arundo donax TaxID=35708 RepID=A0A0A9EDN7_ARUDO
MLLQTLLPIFSGLSNLLFYFHSSKNVPYYSAMH